MVKHILLSLPPVDKGREKENMDLNHPFLTFTSSIYPVGVIRGFISSLFSTFFIFTLVLSIGLSFFEVFLPPNVATWVKENRGAIIFVGFLANSVGSYIVQSGAFEVYLDDVLIFSKLREGKLYSAVDMATIVMKHITDVYV